jgi:RNA polymerase sigma factor (sigma-70 family)
MNVNLEALVEEARQGNRGALEEIVLAIQDRIYGLALRMLWHPEDAADATQEILIRIITHLGTFRKESTFTTWIYRIASNYLLTTRKRRAEEENLTFDLFGQQLDEGLKESALQVQPEVEQRLLEEEIKIGCTHAMLLCLDRDHRLAYVLGEILELSGEEAASILDVTPAAFRKRLSRARQTIQKFMSSKCGIVNPENPCRCAKRIPYAVGHGRINPERLLFAKHPIRTNKKTTIRQVRQLEEWQRAAALYRGHPDYAATDSLSKRIRTLINKQQKELPNASKIAQGKR